MMRKNQKGFTLVELIIAVAILAIVTLAVCGFIVVGSRSYTSANTDILLQQEAQLALNQISDVIIDTTDSITYSVGTGSDMQNVLKDSEYGGEATDKCLVVINRTDTNSNNLNPSYWFYWQKDLETIYFNELPNVDPSKSYDEIQEEIRNADSGRAILAEHVTDLNIDISQFEENRVVMISMTLKNGNREYSTSNNVTVRNRIALNVVDIDPMQRADDFLIKGVTSVVLEPGDEYTFKPIVDTSSGDNALTWELVGGSANGTTYSTSGNECTVRVGLEEQRRNFALRVKRTNEQYAGQNNRVGLTVYVEVKRVNSVNLEAEGSVTKVEPGETIKITGAASGWHLGDRDDSEINDCATVDLLTDDDLEDWGRADGSADFTVVSWDASGATIKIGDTVTEGQEIIIEATSSLSLKRGYNTTPGHDSNPSKPGIQGTCILRVEAGMNSNMIPLDGDLRYGSDNDMKAGMIYDPLYKGMSDFNHYIVCARLREVGNNNKDQDQVILYYRTDKNIRFTPDIFGADITKDYYVFLQLLLPVDKELYVNKGKAANEFQNKDGDDSYNNHQAIVDEYFNHLNSDGEYIGTKYEASAMFYGTIGKPVVHFKCDDKLYPSNNPADVKKYYLAGNNDGDKVFGKATLDKEATINIDLQSQNKLNGKIRFSVYKGDGDNVGSWTRVGGYNPGSSTYDNVNGQYSYFADNMFGSYAQNGGDPDLSNGSNLVVRNSQKESWDDACGTYRIVLGYYYACDENPRDYVFLTNGKRNVHGDYAEHYYDNREGALTLKVEMGMNLPLSRVNDEWTTFPLPTDSAFPFALRSDEVQTTTWEKFVVYSKATAKTTGKVLNNINVDCTYKPAAGSSKECYIIKLYTETRTGMSYTRHVYGEYIWSPGESEWNENGQIGERDEKGEIETNIEITRDGASYLAYFPAPTDSDYPFKSATATSVSRNLKIYQKSGSDSQTIKVNAESQQNGPAYSIKLTGVELQGKHKQATYAYGTYTYSSSSSTWNLTTPGSATKYEAVGVVTIEFNSGKYNIELPLPNMDGYPITSKQDNVGYALDDTYCERNIVMWLAFDAVYSQSGSTYTVTVTPMWNSGPSKTFTWQEGQTNWQPSN